MQIGKKVALAVGAVLATWATASSAQTGAGASALEEIVVTARKRNESLQDAPLTILAFSDTQIEERGIQSVADLSKFSPGLTFNAGTTR